MNCQITDCDWNIQGYCSAPHPEYCITPKQTPEELNETWAKYGQRGFSITNFCPGCMTQLFTMAEGKRAAQAFSKADFPGVKASFSKYSAGFGIYVPGNEEYAQLLSHRVIVHPICSRCMKHAGEPWFEEKVERSIALSLRYVRRLKL